MFAVVVRLFLSCTGLIRLYQDKKPLEWDVNKVIYSK